MKHSEIRARLSEYLERDLEPEERSRIETHLEACAPCGSELRELRATVSLLRRLPEPGHPPGLGEAVMARIAREGSRPAGVRSLLRRAAEPRFAAPLAAGLAGLFFLFQTEGPRQQTQTSATVPSHRVQFASAGLHEARGWPLAFANGLWGPDEPSPRTVAPVRAGVISGATPSGAYQEYARRLRGAGHPYSESLAAHFESQPNVVMADWQPR